jgi:hypothetical protein
MRTIGFGVTVFLLVAVVLSCKSLLLLIASMISYPPYTNFSRGRCLTYIDTEEINKIASVTVDFTQI